MSELGHAVAIEALAIFPPVIRQGLIESPEFRERYDIRTDARILLGRGEITFQRSVFFSAIRHALENPGDHTELAPHEGAPFQVTLEDNGDGGQNIFLRRESKTIRLPDFSCLSSNADTRLKGLDDNVRRRNIAPEGAIDWRRRLTERPLHDDEVDELTTFLKLTPQEVAEVIGQQVRAGTSDVAVLVPASAFYYERLAPNPEAGMPLETYAGGRWRAYVAQLLQWDFGAGLGQALATAPQANLSGSIAIEEALIPDLLKVLDWLCDGGDRFSQVAAVEVGLGLVHRYPQVEGPITRIVEVLLADNPEDEDGRLKLTASLVIFVDGELARLGILRDRQPYWRRLVAIAQASLIERELIEVGVDSSRFADWATSGRGQLFFLQSLVDLRQEPRWIPDFMDPEQLKLEFLGRIAGAGARHASTLPAGALRDLVCGDGPSSVSAAMTFPKGWLPGPLEGGMAPQVPFPDELAQRLREPSSEPLAESALAGFANMALVCRIGEDQARVVTDALRRAKYQLNIGADGDKMFSLLVGLAEVAAVTRAPDLAREVRILARVQRRRAGVKLEIGSLMRIGFIAASSESDLEKWSEAVGEWLTEIANEDLDVDTAVAMQQHVRRLCELVPALWRTCPRAEAAFAAVAGMSGH